MVKLGRDDPKPEDWTQAFTFSKYKEIEKNGRHHPKNALNNLTGKEWIKFLKTWFIHDAPQRKEDEILHPAKYPETMVEEFIKFFTKEGHIVFDPFLGTGSTLVAANRCGRNGVGIELIEKYGSIAKKRISQRSLEFNVRQKVIIGDSTRADFLLKENRCDVVDFIICSPPYWNMLKKSRGGVTSALKDRKNQGLDTYYSEDEHDLGNIDDYDTFVEKLGGIFDVCIKMLKNEKYMVVILQNLRDETGVVRPLSWDIARRISENSDVSFQGERIWCQDSKRLGIWGYPKVFVPNYHHHYCLIFQKGL